MDQRALATQADINRAPGRLRSESGGRHHPVCPAEFIGIGKGEADHRICPVFEFSRETIENLPAEARRVRLAQLGEELSGVYALRRLGGVLARGGARDR